MTKERLLEITKELEDIISEEVFTVYSEEEQAIQEAINILYGKYDDM